MCLPAKLPRKGRLARQRFLTFARSVDLGVAVITSRHTGIVPTAHAFEQAGLTPLHLGYTSGAPQLDSAASANYTRRMAKKSLGYVELEWECPVCQTRNPGSERVCKGCGSPQPPDIQFQTPVAATASRSAEVVAHATAAPDIHCPYCDARNPAGATVCHQCGGDLTQATSRAVGKVLGAPGDSTTAKPVVCPTCGTENPAEARVCKNCGAPLPGAAPKPTPQPAKSNSLGCLWIGGGIALLLVIGLAFIFMGGGGKRTTLVGHVVDTQWERKIVVMGLAPQQRVAWLDQIPADATVGACTDEVRQVVEDPVPGAREVCGTPYAVDQGTGYGELVQDCQYEVLDQRCEYTTNVWQPVDERVLQGAGATANWPTLPAGSNLREGTREERYLCRFSANDALYVYQARTYDEYLLCEPDSAWNLTVNASGRVVEATPVN